MTFVVEDDFLTAAEISDLRLSFESDRPVGQKESETSLAGTYPLPEERPFVTNARWVSQEDALKVTGGLLERTIGEISKRYLSMQSWNLCNARKVRYEVGHRISRHTDGSDKVMASIIYLSESWQPGDGGELIVEVGDDRVEVEPIPGRLVVIGSDLPHSTRVVKCGTRESLVFFFSLIGEATS